jgi:L-threonylcarbamoyladenylate synthase
MLSREMISKAVEILHTDGVVGMPTETVYGLAASIGSETGLKRIFSEKERPFFDPLIVHVANTDQLKGVAASVSPVENALMEHFWPGPLTLILPKHPALNPLITAGLESVGVRCPNHPVALRLSQELGMPVAAPSANKFGRTSPTRAWHVQSELPGVFVLDGGDCEFGVESTVGRVNQHDGIFEIYRPGSVTVENLEEFFTSKGIPMRVELRQSPVAPGQLQHHYQPAIPVVLARVDAKDSSTGVESLKRAVESFDPTLTRAGVVEFADSAVLAARLFYQRLREASQTDANYILLVRKPTQAGGVWTALWNRAEKAATFILESGKVRRR